MKDELLQRLQSLQQKFTEGEQLKENLTAKLTSIDNTLLRISGAIQVLEELLKDAEGNQQPKESGSEANNTNSTCADHPDLNMLVGQEAILNFPENNPVAEAEAE